MLCPGEVYLVTLAFLIVREGSSHLLPKAWISQKWKAGGLLEGLQGLNGGVGPLEALQQPGARLDQAPLQEAEHVDRARPAAVEDTMTTLGQARPDSATLPGQRIFMVQSRSLYLQLGLETGDSVHCLSILLLCTRTVSETLI